MPYRVPDDDLAKRKKNYYRNKRPDLDPQSTVSKIMEFFGADEPYREDEGSYDYRRQAWEESKANGQPDVSWMIPELGDNQVAWAMDFYDDLPDGWKGTNDREGNRAVGALAHGLDQFNWSPWETKDILSMFGDSPATVQRDMRAYKGGESTVDRMVADAIGPAFGADISQEPDHEPGYRETSRSQAVEATEWGGLIWPFAIPAKAARAAKAAKRLKPNTTTHASAEPLPVKRPPHYPDDPKRPIKKRSLPKPGDPIDLNMPVKPAKPFEVPDSIRDDILKAARRKR